MQRGFTKLFNTIVTSTIWQEDDKTRIVWITMLAIADADGVVSASIPGLASVANVEIEACEKAVRNLESPDEYSRTTDFEGRRIEPVEGGWHVLNYAKYRRMLSEEERKEYKARWAREKRQRMSKTNVDKRGQTATAGRQTRIMSTQAEAEAEAEGTLSKRKCTKTQACEFAVALGLLDSDGEWFFWKGEGNGWTNAGKAIKNWQAVMRAWSKAHYFPSQKQQQRLGFGPTNPERPWQRFNKDGRRVDENGRVMDSNQIRKDDEYHEMRKKHG